MCLPLMTAGHGGQGIIIHIWVSALEGWTAFAVGCPSDFRQHSPPRLPRSLPRKMKGILTPLLLSFSFKFITEELIKIFGNKMRENESSKSRKLKKKFFLGNKKGKISFFQIAWKEKMVFMIAWIVYVIIGERRRKARGRWFITDAQRLSRYLSIEE